MLFNELELKNRVNHNYGLFGETDAIYGEEIFYRNKDARNSTYKYYSIKDVVINRLTDDDDKFSNFICNYKESENDDLLSYAMYIDDADADDGIIRFKGSSIYKVNDSTKKLSNVVIECNKSNITIYTDTEVLNEVDEITSEYSNFKYESKPIDIGDKMVNIVVLYTANKGPISVRIYDAEFDAYDMKRDLPNIEDTNCIFNSLQDNVVFSKKVTKTIPDTNVHIMDASGKYEAITDFLPDEELHTEEDGSIVYTNNDTKVKSIKFYSDKESRHCVTVRDYSIYDIVNKVDSNGNPFTNYLYGYLFENGKYSYYLKDNCYSIYELPDNVFDKYEQMSGYIADLINIPDSEEDIPTITEYKDKSEDIYTIVIKADFVEAEDGSKSNLTNIIYRVIDDSIGIIYCNSGSTLKTIVMDFDEGTIPISVTTNISSSDTVTRFNMIFDTDKLQFVNDTYANKNGVIVRRYYKDSTIEIDVSYKEDGSIDNICKFESSIYNKSIDKFVYIRDEYGVPQKLNIVNE